MDVPAIISDLLQQFFVEFVKVPQLQFIDIVVGFVVRRDRYTVQTVQKTVVIAQVQFLGRLGYPSLYNDRCFGLQSRKLWKFRSCSALTGWSMFPLQFIDKVGRSRDPAAASSRRQSDRMELGHDGSEGMFGAFCAIFRAPPVIRS